MTESAQLFKGVHDTPVYTDILFKKPLRLWVAISLYGGTALTVVLTILTLDSGHARAILIYGLILTGAAAGGAALIPRQRPTLRFRIASAWRALRPDLASSASDPLLAPPRTVIGNLSFTAHGVYAHYLISGLPYYLQSTKRRIGVADRHQALAREIPAGTWVFGLSVPQNQRQLLRAMLDGHRDKHRWINACRQMAPVIAAQTPHTRIYWLALPVDAGRAGHSPAGQVAKVRDWVIGRDKDSDDSMAAYQRLAHDIITAIPEEFGPQPVSADMMDWFWRHNAWRGVFNNPLPRRATTDQLDTTALPVAVFDDGDQLHHGGRTLPLRLIATALAGAAAAAGVLVGPLLAAPPAALAAVALLAWTAGIRRIPSWSTTLRISSPAGAYPDSYQAILPVVDMPKAGIVFPGSEFLQALDDLDTGATFDFAVNLVTLSREMEFVRNDRAKGNIDDQFTQRRDVRNGDAELIATWRQLAEYNRQLASQHRRTAPAHRLRHRRRRPRPAHPGLQRQTPARRTHPIGPNRHPPLPRRPNQTVGGLQPRRTHPQNHRRPVRPTHHHQKMVTVRAVHLLHGRQQHRNPVGIQPKQRTQQRSAARPARRRPPQPQPVSGVQRCPGIRQILCRQTHHPRRNPARYTSIHRRPRHRMAKGPLRRRQQSRHRHGGQPLQLRPAAHLPAAPSWQLLAGLHDSHDEPGPAQCRR